MRYGLVARNRFSRLSVARSLPEGTPAATGPCRVLSKIAVAYTPSATISADDQHTEEFRASSAHSAISRSF
jgi:hypothetical protein